MTVVYGLMSLQGLWIMLAVLHHRVRLQAEARIAAGDAPPHGPGALLTLPPGLVALWLPLLRYLTYLEMPGLSFGPGAPAWLRHGADQRDGAAPTLRALARWGTSLKGGRPGALVLAALVALLSVLPVVALALTAYGLRVGDPTARPDGIAAIGLYLVSCGALIGARAHTRSSPLLLLAHPAGGALSAGALVWSCVTRRAQAPPATPTASGAGAPPLN